MWRSVWGLDNIALNAAGELVLATDDGEMRLEAPHVYQNIGGKSRTLPAGSHYAHRCRIRTRSLRSTRTLVIDPVLTYSSFLAEVATKLLYDYRDCYPQAPWLSAIAVDSAFIPTSPVRLRPLISAEFDAFSICAGRTAIFM